MSFMGRVWLKGEVNEVARVSAMEVSGRRDTSEFTEVMNEVRLIIVATRQCHLRPVDVIRFPCSVYNIQKAAQAGKLLRRHPHVVAEDRDKLPVA